jgi:hypothetical protein
MTTNDQMVQYGSSESASRAIHSALSGLGVPPPGCRVTRLEFTWTTAKFMETLKAYEGADLLFTLTFTWNTDGTPAGIERT